MTETLSRSARQIDLTETFAAHNDPLPVVASHGDGSWVSDVDGRRPRLPGRLFRAQLRPPASRPDRSRARPA